MTCHQEALGRILTEAPTAVIKWALNGVDVDLDGTRVVMKSNKNLGNLITLYTYICNLFKKVYFYPTNLNYYEAECYKTQEQLYSYSCQTEIRPLLSCMMHLNYYNFFGILLCKLTFSYLKPTSVYQADYH
jgi:hypothetical protein